MKEFKIPTKLTGKRFTEVIQGRLHHLYPTDVGLLTATQIGKRCKIKVDKVRNRYNRAMNKSEDGWKDPDILSHENLIPRATASKTSGQSKDDFEYEPDPELKAMCMNLGTKLRDKDLTHLNPGKWERK